VALVLIAPGRRRGHHSTIGTQPLLIWAKQLGRRWRWPDCPGLTWTSRVPMVTHLMLASLSAIPRWRPDCPGRPTDQSRGDVATQLHVTAKGHTPRWRWLRSSGRRGHQGVIKATQLTSRQPGPYLRWRWPDCPLDADTGGNDGDVSDMGQPSN
jgi:hypothetical protein